MQATAILKVDKIRAVQESILVGCDSGSLTNEGYAANAIDE
jgi:hypothetical protein